MVGIYACELHVFAEIVPPVQTEKTCTAWNAGFDGYTIAWDVLIIFHV